MPVFMDPSLLASPDLMNQYMESAIAHARQAKGASPTAFADKLEAYLKLIYDSNRDAIDSNAALDSSVMNTDLSSVTIDNSVPFNNASSPGALTIRGENTPSPLTVEEENIVRFEALMSFTSMITVRRTQQRQRQEIDKKNKAEKKTQEEERQQQDAQVDARAAEEQKALEAKVLMAARERKRQEESKSNQG